ncbi:MAG: phosphoglycerate kinase [Pseudomonadota bacterium]
MAYKTLDDIDLSSKRVLIRVDINVPVDDGVVTDATRVERILPTVRDVMAKGGKPILLAHFGRPKGRVAPDMSLKVTLGTLAEVLGADIRFSDNCIGEEAVAASNALAPGDVLLLENTRFHPGEETNDPTFAAELAKSGDVYVNDAFSAAHRAHASTEGLARLLPAAAGRNMQAELEALEKALAAPQRPVVAVVGGAKVSTKLDLLGNLVAKVDHLVIGGGMANTFLAAQGYDVGKSLCEHELGDTAREIMDKAKTAGCELVLPVDVVVAGAFKAHADNHVADVKSVPADAMILDAGPQSITEITARFDRAKTLVWNGPLGAFEIEPFNAATNAAAQYAAERTASGELLSVAGGGDTVAALNAAGAGDRFTYVSTAGGAFLEWLEGKTLPGVAALEAG